MKVYQTTTQYNCGIDLHARCMYICVMNKEGKILVHKNIKNNDFDYFLKVVAPYRHDLTVACESTFSRASRDGPDRGSVSGNEASAKWQLLVLVG